jgi:hypothetical protein
MSLEKKNSWLEDRRDLFVCNLLREFYKAYTSFLLLYEGYTATQELSFADVEHLVGSETSKGVLWRLKDRCHQLWRMVDPKVDLHGCLLDWMLGALFHEAMKLKENVYMYQFYGPVAQEMAAQEHDRHARFATLDSRQFMRRTFEEMQRQMDIMGAKFVEANHLIRIMLPDQAGNALLVRYLLEHDSVSLELWAEPLEALLASMYNGAPEAGYMQGARSYLQGHWHEKALGAFQKALALNPGLDEARCQVHQLRAIIKASREAAAAS